MYSREEEAVKDQRTIVLLTIKRKTCHLLFLSFFIKVDESENSKLYHWSIGLYSSQWKRVVTWVEGRCTGTWRIIWRDATHHTKHFTNPKLKLQYYLSWCLFYWLLLYWKKPLTDYPVQSWCSVTWVIHWSCDNITVWIEVPITLSLDSRLSHFSKVSPQFIFL